MARYKPVDPHPSKMLPVRFADQILPGTFEYAGHWLVDHGIDPSVFEARYRNDHQVGPIYSIFRRVLPWCYQTRSPRNVHYLAEIA